MPHPPLSGRVLKHQLAARAEFALNHTISMEIDPKPRNRDRKWLSLATTPAPNPSDENIRNWLTLIERKNQIMERLKRRMIEYGAGQNVPTPTNSIIPA